VHDNRNSKKQELRSMIASLSWMKPAGVQSTISGIVEIYFTGLSHDADAIMHKPD